MTELLIALDNVVEFVINNPLYPPSMVTLKLLPILVLKFPTALPDA